MTKLPLDQDREVGSIYVRANQQKNPVEYENNLIYV